MTRIDRASLGTGIGSLEVQPAAAAVAISAPWARDVLELTKPGIVKMVVVATCVGFGLAAMGHQWTTLSLLMTALWCIVGTVFSGAGANALNMAMEVRRDSKMHRTRNRPMPAGRMTPVRGATIGFAMSLAGIVILLLGTNAVAALVSLVTIVSYVLIYTPSKPITPLSTLIGAVPGALPPVIGWTAASTGALHGITDMGAWALFAIMFVWQIPHFLAIAWKYREDYARGGHRVLPVVEPKGHSTAWTALVWSLALVPLSLTPVLAMPGRLGPVYMGVATIAGLWMAWVCLKLVLDRSDASARRVFIVSIVYLPLVLVTMVADAVITGLG